MVENVPGLANDKQFSVFRKRMEEAGYLGDQDVFNAADLQCLQLDWPYSKSKRNRLSADSNSPEGFVANILVQALAWVAQEESDAISRRTVAGLARARAQGKRT